MTEPIFTPAPVPAGAEPAPDPTPDEPAEPEPTSDLYERPVVPLLLLPTEIGGCAVRPDRHVRAETYHAMPGAAGMTPCVLRAGHDRQAPPDGGEDRFDHLSMLFVPDPSASPADREQTAIPALWDAHDHEAGA